MTHPLFDLTGQTSLITGSGRGTGLSPALGLASAGARRGLRLHRLDHQTHPRRRWGQLPELQGACIFLASPAASCINGQVLFVDGGMSACL